MIGQTIDDRYRIEMLIGRGGMGVVYRATDLVENHPVALKLLHHLLDSQSEIAFSRFHREFRVLARLNHPNIVQAYAFGTVQDVPYLVLEFLDGRTLAEETAGNPLPRDQILLIARQICEALTHLHTQSIVHRDLKPGNIMLLYNVDSPPVKLMDFGLVRVNNMSMQLTQEGVALGTVAYMAPEQAQGLPIDFRADLYALGIIMYEMATGRTPFVHENPAMILMQQLTGIPAPPGQLNPNLDEPLEQLILDLLAKEPAQRPPSTEAVISTLAELANQTIPAPSPSPKRADIIPRVPLIGRATALNVIVQHWTSVQTGQGQVVLVSGAAGMGKTRLLTEASLPVQLGNRCYLQGKCHEYGSLPYEPLPEILQELVQSLPASARVLLPDELNMLISGKPPSSIADTPQAANQAEARARLFAGVWQLFQVAAQQQPLMIAIEDIQWIEPTTLELCNYLIHRVSQVPILLILTLRPEELEANTPLTNLNDEQSIHMINLDPLTREQVADYLQVALGQERISAGLIDNFHQATDGTPLFIEETLKALAAEGQVEHLVKKDSSQSVALSAQILQLPQNVLALAERRLQILSDADRSVLTAAAVLGPELSFDLWQSVAKVDEDTLLDAIDRLLAARLIEEMPLQDGKDLYHFTQEALRQSLLNTISRRRLRRLHQRAGETMQDLYDTSQQRYWPALARHFAESGNPSQALIYFTQSGDGAARMYANAEAVIYYTQAIEIAKQVPIVDDQLTDLYTRRGRVLEIIGQFDEALANYQELELLADENNQPSLKLAALIPQATIHATRTIKFDPDRGRELSNQTLDLARQLNNPRSEAKSLWNLMLLETYAGNNPQRSLDFGEQSLDIARRHNLREEMAYALHDLTTAYLELGRTEEGLAAQDEARELWREIGNLPMLVDNLAGSASTQYMVGNYDVAMKLAREGLEASRSIGNVWGQANSLGIIGPIHLARGEIGEGLEAFEEVIPLADEANFVIPLNARVILAWLYGELGNFDYAFELARAAEEKTEGFPGYRPYVLAVRGLLYVYSNDPAKAKAAIEDAYQEFDTDEAISKLMFDWFFYMMEAKVLLANQEYQHGLEVINRVIEKTRIIGIRPFLPAMLLLRGKALLALGHITQAHETLLESLAEAQNLSSNPNPFDLSTLVLLSEIEAQLGDLDQAQAFRQQAQEAIEFMANQLSSDLRTKFLALPHIRKVLEKT